MRFEVGFVACYALVLLGAAAGLHRLGKRNTSPWTSRALAGHRRQAPEPLPVTDPADWPHSDARRLHTLIALVIVTAVLTLAITEVVRHHRGAEVLVLCGVALLAVVELVRLGGALGHHDEKDRR